MRNTSQRTLILEYLKSVKSHPTAMEIFQEVRNKLPNISFATVYRNLNVMTENGLAQELKMTESHRFDGNTDNHYHFFCRECGKVEDVEMAPIDSLTASAQRVTDAEIDSHRVQFIGRCFECRQKTGGKDGNERKS